jgi:hypothetical protein
MPAWQELGFALLMRKSASNTGRIRQEMLNAAVVQQRTDCLSWILYNRAAILRLQVGNMFPIWH